MKKIMGNDTQSNWLYLRELVGIYLDGTKENSK